MFIGFTRVYSCARFIHQVLLSYVTGIIGLALSLNLEEKVAFIKLTWQAHWIYLFFCIFVVVGVISLAVEDNSTHFGSIPKSEYVRVVGGIFNTDPSEIHEHMHMQASKKLDNLTMISEKARQKYAERLYSRKDR